MAATLVAARRVLVTGFAAAAVETAALACDLAESLGAAVDPGAIDCGQIAGPTIARIGAVTADIDLYAYMRELTLSANRTNASIFTIDPKYGQSVGLICRALPVRYGYPVSSQ